MARGITGYAMAYGEPYIEYTISAIWWGIRVFCNYCTFWNRLIAYPEKRSGYAYAYTFIKLFSIHTVKDASDSGGMMQSLFEQNIVATFVPIGLFSLNLVLFIWFTDTSNKFNVYFASIANWFSNVITAWE